MKKAKFAWHVHHSGDIMGVLTKPIKIRQEYIRKYKPEHEQETRLRLLKPVKGKLPTGLVQTATDYRDACTYVKFVLYKEAIRTYLHEIVALHKKECPNCPWDGWTIFP